MNHQSESSDPTVLPADLAQQVPEAVLHLKSALRSGAPWYQALLEAIALWTLPQETYHQRHYQYLIEGEALDWLLLAERLCAELDGPIPRRAQELLLFHGLLPEEVSPDMFRDLIGPTKHRAYLNYWYGVVVEEALQLAVEEEVRKRHRSGGYPDSEDFVEEAFTLLYADTRTTLLDRFCRESQLLPVAPPEEDGPGDGPDLSLADLKGFTYWLFKRRFNQWDPARVASDTRKGIRRLRLLEQTREFASEPSEPAGSLEP